MSIGNGEYVDAQSPEGKAILEQRRAKAEQQRAAGIVTNTRGRTNLGTTYRNMGLPANQAEKNKAATEAMKQFNLNTFQRAAPGILFGQGDSGFQSPAMKARGIGFNNIYNSLFGMGDMQNY